MSTLTKPRITAPVNPREPLTLLRREMEDLFTRFWDGEAPKSWFGGPFAPTADVIEGENAFEVRMDLPGMEAKEIDVQVHGATVTVSGKRKEEKEENGATFHRVERMNGAFSRTITLPTRVNEGEVAASYDQGVLTLKLPKREEVQAAKINVKG